MITCTSEMSGRASRGIRFMDQMPAITSRKVPVNTRNRLRAHHSMVQLITLHPSCSVHRELLGRDYSSVLASDNRDLPRPARSQITLAFIQTIAFVAEIYAGLHSRHTHRRHSRHEEREVDLRAGDGRTVSPGEFYVEDVAAFARWVWIRRPLHIGLRRKGSNVFHV